MTRGLLVLALAALGGCSLFGHEGGGSSSDDAVLFSGTSFGECIGYCIAELTVDGTTATLTYSGWGRDRNFPDIRYERTLRASERTRLDRAFDRTALHRADEVYGCPDCADGGAEWVGATWDGGEKRVTFEHGTEGGGLDAYIVAMRDLRVSFPDAPRP